MIPKALTFSKNHKCPKTKQPKQDTRHKTQTLTHVRQTENKTMNTQKPELPEGDMMTSCWGLGTDSSWTLIVILPPVPDTHPRL